MQIFLQFWGEFNEYPANDSKTSTGLLIFIKPMSENTQGKICSCNLAEYLIELSWTGKTD